MNKKAGASVDLSPFKIDFTEMLNKRSDNTENPRPQQQRRLEEGSLSSSKDDAVDASSTAASGDQSDL